MPPPLTPSPHPSGGKWSKKAVAITSAIALAVLGGAAGTAFTLWLAPQQQLRQQEGLDNAQEQFDSSNPSLVIKGARYSKEVRSAATSRLLDLNDFTQNFHDPAIAEDLDSNLLPPGEDIQPGPLEYYLSDYPAQPRVYDSVHVTLVGNHYKPVKVTDVSIHVLSRAIPPSGTIVYTGPQGGAPSESIGFDLDSRDLAARVNKTDTDTANETPQHYFDNRQVTLNRFEQLDVKLVVFTSNCLCSFNFTVTTDDGHTYTVDDNGKPWQVSAFAPHYARSYGFDVNGYKIVPCSWPNECIHNYE